MTAYEDHSINYILTVKVFLHAIYPHPTSFLSLSILANSTASTSTGEKALVRLEIAASINMV